MRPILFLSLLAFFVLPANTFAEEIPSAPDVQDHLNFVWTLMAAFLVFFMQAGFAMVEVGFTRAKNASNIIMKNLMDFCIGALAFWAVGFGIMFGASRTGWLGTDGFFFSDFIKDVDPWLYAFWMFQVVFAATAATIISGAMAERTRFIGYLFYSLVMSAFVYPVFGGWAWGGLYHGGGWLEKLGFIDFAGSTVVHSVGGWAALAGAIVVGPRTGKFTSGGEVKPIPGHSLPLAALGVFILWFGWYGFNAGSTTAGNKDIAVIAVNTTLSAATGALFAMITAWVRYGIPDVGITLNGALAGLVGITAGCANMAPAFAVVSGAVAGILVVFSIAFFERRKVDDPVGAISVHGVCGVWGTLAAGLFHGGEGFSAKIIGVQLLGITACFLWVFPAMYFTFKLIHRFVGLRVSVEDEYNGLDFSEHGATSYPDFPVTSTH
ncbi:MAG: ammonium transporter [bacterium]